MYSLRAYADTEGVPFDLLSDHWPHGAIAQADGVFDELAGCARRGTFVLDSAGLIETPPYGSHLGQRSSDRTTKAGHMTASDPRFRMPNSLPGRGPSTHAPGVHGCPDQSPGMTK